MTPLVRGIPRGELTQKLSVRELVSSKFVTVPVLTDRQGIIYPCHDTPVALSPSGLRSKSTLSRLFSSPSRVLSTPLDVSSAVK